MEPQDPHRGPDRLAAFAGRWRVAREIADARGPDGQFAGAAVFAPAPGGLAYHETGTLTLGGQRFEAARRYLWTEPAPGELLVLFPDGRPFHALTLAPRATAAHDCPPDDYRLAFDFTGWPVWQVTHRVTGPRKDYRMHTVYTPA
jgi:hypothetical protein